MNDTKICLLFLMAVLIVVPSGLYAQWDGEGVPLCSVDADQLHQQIAPDGAGGAIVVWEDYRDVGDVNIWAQRIDRFGFLQWSSSGSPACIIAEDQVNPQIAADGYGGAYIVWEDYRNSSDWDVYVQRIDPSGSPMWPSDIILYNPDGDQLKPKIIVEQGKLIVVWIDIPRPGDGNVYAQMIDKDGNLLWGSGVAVATGLSDDVEAWIVSDCDGGAIIVWSPNIDGQRLNRLGAELWASGGVDLNADGAELTVISDGEGGAVLAYSRNYPNPIYGESSWDIYCQLVDSEGVVNHAYPGSRLDMDHTAFPDPEYPLNQTKPRLVLTGEGISGIQVICNEANKLVTKMYSSLSGGASVICESYVSGRGFALVPTGLERFQSGDQGYILVYVEDNSPSDDLVGLANESNCFHTYYLNGSDIAVSTDLAYPVVAPNGSGGGIVATGSNRVIAWKVDRMGCPGHFMPEIESVVDVPDDEGGKVEITWSASDLDYASSYPIDNYTLWRSLTVDQSAMMIDNGASVIDCVSQLPVKSIEPGKIIRRELVGSQEYFWEYVGMHYSWGIFPGEYDQIVSTSFDRPATSSEAHYFQVIAQTDDHDLFIESPPVSGYSRDNVAPSEPSGLSGIQNDAEVGLEISWAENPEGDIWMYMLYKGYDSDFTPDLGNCIKMTSETSFIDTEWIPFIYYMYYYKLSAVDVCGNEGVVALLEPHEVILTGEEPAPIPAATFLQQNFPNPFNPATRIKFGLKEPGHVTLRVYDASGRLIRTLVDENRPAGRYEEEWNGLDNMGSATASGVYFYRLTAHEFVETRKMILLR